MSTDGVEVGYMLNFHPERKINKLEYNIGRKSLRWLLYLKIEMSRYIGDYLH
jgi:hypothetical protein